MHKPSINELPEIKLSFHEMSGFISKHDQVPYFREKWQNDYYKNIEALWTKKIQDFKSGSEADCSWRELILVATFDYYLGPYVGLPEKIKMDFYKWLVAGMRQDLINGAA